MLRDSRAEVMLIDLSNDKDKCLHLSHGSRHVIVIWTLEKGYRISEVTYRKLKWDKFFFMSPVKPWQLQILVECGHSAQQNMVLGRSTPKYIRHTPVIPDSCILLKHRLPTRSMWFTFEPRTQILRISFPTPLAYCGWLSLRVNAYPRNQISHQTTE